MQISGGFLTIVSALTIAAGGEALRILDGTVGISERRILVPAIIDVLEGYPKE